MQAFKDVTRECGLSEMKFIGSRFTWSCRNGTELILERLDHGFVNDAFGDKFAYSYENHMLGPLE